MKTGVNTFGLGAALKRDARGTWQGLYDGGIRYIEPSIAIEWDPLVSQTDAEKERGRLCGVFPMETGAETVEYLRSLGFDVISFHLQTSNLTLENLQKTVEFMEKANVHYCIFSLMEQKIADVQPKEEVIRAGVKLFREHGLEFLLHNHNMEWTPDGDTCVMRWLIETITEMYFEVDLGWAEYAGVSSLEVLNSYPGRFPILHLKDIAAGTEAWGPNPFCVAPGDGILPLTEILEWVDAQAEKPELVIDLDDSIKGDIVKDIAKGVERIEAFFAGK